MSAQPLDVRIAHLEGAYEQINYRLGTVEQRLGNVELKFDSLHEAMDRKFEQIRSEMDARFAVVDQKFLWVIGLIVVSIIIPIAQRFLVHG